MFGFFNRKKKPVPIFESLGTDMHCHLVPGVDDGSKDTEESIECFKIMESLGFKRLYITPHFQYPRYQNDEEDIKQRFEKLKQKAIEAGVGLELVAVAGEYRIDDRFAERTENGRFLTIDNKYVLTELSLHQQRMGTADSIFALQGKGYEVILAHPERYPYLGSTSALLEQLKNQDVLFQVNILSLAGFYGEMAQHIAYDLIEKGWAELLGTDMHNTTYAQALVKASHDRRLQKTLDKCEFLNRKM